MQRIEHVFRGITHSRVLVFAHRLHPNGLVSQHRNERIQCWIELFYSFQARVDNRYWRDSLFPDKFTELVNA